jgi:hypothetical protein
MKKQNYKENQNTSLFSLLKELVLYFYYSAFSAGQSSARSASTLRYAHIRTAELEMKLI